MIEIPKIEINVEQRKWLSLIYEKFLAGQEFDERILFTELWGAISPDFTPREIDSRLLRGGEITLLGILQLDPQTKFVSLCDKVIITIRELLLKDRTVENVSAEELATLLGANPNDVGHALRLISHLGRFWAGASMREFRVISANVGEAYKQYFQYKGIEPLLMEFSTEQKKKPDSYLDQFRIASLADTWPGESDEKVVDGGNVEVNPIFRTRVSEIDRKLCFVLMPFTEEWSKRVYEQLIRPSVEQLGLQCLRADELNGQIVIEDIWVKINQCAFVIADVTNRNPNVMYELGIVHTIGKPAVLITQNFATIPFDFTHLRHYGYSDNVDGFRELSEKLRVVIPDIYKESYGTNM